VKILDIWKCPVCGAPLRLVELGSYSGYRMLSPGGRIEEGYIEQGSDVEHFLVRCDNLGCNYENRDIEVSGDRVEKKR
jgi:hypothetical protein